MTSYQIRADVFPTIVTITSSDGEVTTYDKTRIIITLDHVFVFRDAQPQPEIVFEDRLTSYTPPVPATRVRKATQLLNRTAFLETEDEYKLSFIKMGSCGCGSRLKTAQLSSLLPNNQIGQAVSTHDQ